MRQEEDQETIYSLETMSLEVIERKKSAYQISRDIQKNL